MTAPYKLTPIHQWHSRHGAQMTDAAGWKRVLAYGDPTGELRASRFSVGLCDVTSIAKVDVQGKHVEGKLSNFLGVSMPAVRTCVSAVLPGAQGLGPGYVVRLTADRYMVLAAPEDRLRLVDRLGAETRDTGCVHVTDVTSAYAAINIVGPKTMDLLKGLGPAQVDALQHDQCLQTSIARVTSIIIRRNLGSLPGCLLIVPRDYGEYVWECIIHAGRDLGIRPFGLTTERILTGAEARDVATV